MKFAEPVEVVVPAPAGLSFPTLHYQLVCPHDADRRIRNLHAWIVEVEALDAPTVAQLFKVAHWYDAIDKLLEGRIEVKRREDELLVEAIWLGSYPGTLPPSGDVLGQASSEAVA